MGKEDLPERENLLLEILGRIGAVAAGTAPTVVVSRILRVHCFLRAALTFTVLPAFTVTSF